MQNVNLSLSALHPGDVFTGFQLVKKEVVEAIGAELYTLRHQKTGAQLLYSKRDCDNKTFAVAFQTLPENSTGVFHILEHSVLNGSDKYPVKEPFVSLMQSSMQTFLNAMTFPDKTVYPVSSRNEQDFRNLVKVYLDAVFCPAIYHRPEIFMQEGWHYELESPESQPSFNGVVFSEMKGAFSSVNTVIDEQTKGLLFPDSCYHFCSGGDPKHIPELSYEDFLAAHRRFYHPSNARFFLDGDMEIEPLLKYIDAEYLSGYSEQEKDFAIAHQTPVTQRTRACYQAAPGEEENAHLVLSKIACDFDDYEKIYAIYVLCDVLTGSNEAPLTRGILEAGLAQDLSLQLNAGTYQPYLVLHASNTRREQFDAISETLRTTVGRLIENGLDQKTLAASLERMAFRCREVSEPYGLNLCMKALDAWMYGGDPTAHWDTENIFASLRRKLKDGYFTELLQELLAEPETMCRLELIPSVEQGAQDAGEEAARLQAIFDSWDHEQRQKAYDDFAHLRAWQQTPDSPEAMMCLPRLQLSDIPETVPELKTELETVSGCELLRVHTDTHGIVYLDLFFSLADFSTEELRLASVLIDALGELSTVHYTARELQNEIKTWLGGFYGKLELVSRDGAIDSCTPYLHLTFSLLEENAQQALGLVRELLNGSRYSETDKLREILLQNDYANKQSLVVNGNRYAVTKALAPFSVNGTLNEALFGESMVKWFSALEGSFDAEGQKLMDRLADLHNRIFCRSRLTLSLGGRLADEVLQDLLDSLEPGAEITELERCCSGEKQSLVEIPAGVNYCGMAHNLYALGDRYSGAAVVLGTVMSYGYLWNAVRVQGGAYGAGLSVGQSGNLACYSYRDPNPEGTIAAFKQIPLALEGLCSSNMPLDGFIIGSLGQTDPLVGPGEICQMAALRYLKGTSYVDLCRIRHEILHTSLDDFRALIPALREFAVSGAVCVVGSKNGVPAEV